MLGGRLLIEHIRLPPTTLENIGRRPKDRTAPRTDTAIALENSRAVPVPNKMQLHSIALFAMHLLYHQVVEIWSREMPLIFPVATRRLPFATRLGSDRHDNIGANFELLQRTATTRL